MTAKRYILRDANPGSPPKLNPVTPTYNDMLNPKIQDALNAQINAEFWSAYFYMSMAVHFESTAFRGMANWFKVQWHEEIAHAEILMNYLIARGGKVTLEPVGAVPNDWDEPLAAFEATLDHEQKVTAAFNKLYALAEKEHDYATRGRLDWFISEQVEEEETVQTLIERLKLVGKDGMALFMIDQELSSRSYTTPEPLN